MHKIHSKPFSIDDFSCDHMTDGTKKFMETVVAELENIRLRFKETKSKDDWYDMIQLLPSSYNQMRTCTFNYETLINIYRARKNHKDVYKRQGKYHACIISCLIFKLI